jgi:hypothetical protein
MGGLLLFVGYGRFRNLYQKVRIYFLASLLGMGGLGFIRYSTKDLCLIDLENICLFSSFLLF